MINLIVRSKWLWLTLIASLIVLIIMSIYCIFCFHSSNTYWKQKFVIANTQYIVHFKQEKIQLTQEMKKWLEQPNVRKKKYYRAVIKGYGAHMQLLSGSGMGTPSVKHFFVSESQISIQGCILKLPKGLFCGNWQLIYITPEQYIFYIYKKN